MENAKGILVVDDDANIRFILAAVLKRLGSQIKVDTAKDGREALNKIAQEPLDLVITDIEMPYIDGVEVTKQLQSLSPGTKVLWVTGNADYQVHNIGRRLGIYKCFEKPVRIEQIRSAVLEALEVEHAEFKEHPES